MKDASRSVGVCQQLVTPRDARRLRRACQGGARAPARTASQQERQGAAIVARPGARAKIQDRLDRVRAARAAASSASRRSTNYPLEELVPYIDWMPFFNAWEFAGQVSGHPAATPGLGEAASALYADATRMLEQVIARAMARGARASSDSSRPTASATTISRCIPDEARAARLLRLHQLRQQKAKPQGQAQLCLADFIAPAQSGRAGLSGRLRGHRRHRHRGAYRALRGGA